MRHSLLYVCLIAALLGMTALPARASRDLVQFGSNIQIPQDASVHDIVCFFCNVEAQGTIEGDVVVFFGGIHIEQRANKDVVDFFGNIRAENNASVGKGIVSMFGSIHLGDHVSVGKDVVAMFGNLYAAPSATVAGDRVVQPGWLFWAPLIAFILVIYFLVQELRTRRRRAYMAGYPYPPGQRPGPLS